MEIEKSSWDSDFFNLNVGKICLSNVNESILKELHFKCFNDNFDLVYLFEKVAKIDLKTTKIDLKINTKVRFKKKISKVHSDLEDIVSLVDVDKTVLNQLYDLALESGVKSRFKVDRNFGELNFVLLYKKWVDNSINYSIADEVFVYKENSNIIGFITVKYTSKEAVIGLLAVNKLYRGRKIGTKLIEKVEEQALKIGCLNISVDTQLENKLACNFYQKNKFQLIEMTNIYHIWK